MKNKETNKFNEEFELIRADLLIADGVIDSFNKNFTRKEKNTII